MTDLKTNYKGIYDDYGCRACGKADESQSHILECEELQSRNEEIYESLKFENIFDGNVKEHLKIARIIKQNMKIKEEMEKYEKFLQINYFPGWDHVTCDIFYHVCSIGCVY